MTGPAGNGAIVVMGSVLLVFRAGSHRRWRGWLSLALLLGVMGGAVLTAAAGARRTDTAYPRLLAWGHASDMQVIPSGNGTMAGYFSALRRLPQVADEGTETLLNMTVRTRAGFAPYNTVQVFASPDGRLGTAVDRVKILAGQPLNPADPRAVMVNQQMASMQHTGPGGTIRLFAQASGQGRHGPAAVRFRVAAVAVFNSQIIPAVSGGHAIALISPAFLRHARAAGLTDGYAALVRLTPGADAARFLRRAQALAGRYPGTGKISAVFAADAAAATERSIRPDAVALALFAALAGLVTLVVIGQLLRRQLMLESDWFGVLRALGMARRELAVLSLARAALATLGGGVLAVLIAVAASPLMPIGPARIAEPAPGLTANLAYLAVGFALVTLMPLAVVMPAAWAAARRAGAPGRSPGRPAGQPSRLAAALSRTGLVTGAIGLHMAFEPGEGRTTVPVRSSLAAVAAAVTAITAAAVFGASLVALVTTQHRYGQNWSQRLDLGFGAVPAPVLTRLASAEPGVTGLAGGDYGQVSIAGQAVSAVGLTPLRGHGYLTLLAGHLPAGPGQVALGERTLRSLHLRLGQTVRVAASDFGSFSRAGLPMRVVGQVVFPAFGRGTYNDTDLGNGAVVWPALLSQPFPQTGCTRMCYNFVLLRYRPGTSLAAAGTRLLAATRRFGCPVSSCSVSTDQRPIDIQDYAGLRSTPLVLGGVLAVLGIAALAHVLITGVRRRRRDLVILKILGMRRRQLVQVVTWQAAALAAAALLAGVPLGLLAGRYCWVLFAQSVGVPADVRLPGLFLLAEITAVVLIAVLTAGPAGRAAARLRAAPVLRAE